MWDFFKFIICVWLFCVLVVPALNYVFLFGLIALGAI